LAPICSTRSSLLSLLEAAKELGWKVG